MLGQLAVLVTAFTAVLATQCGRPTILPDLRASNGALRLRTGSNGRILGGIEATPHSWPWMAYLLKNGARAQCGASIINSEWILTAAHCFPPPPVPATGYQILVGAHDLRTPSAGSKAVNVARIIIHPQWDGGKITNDLALVKLSEPLQFDSHVSPICLADASDDKVGRKSYVTGWGWSDHPSDGTESRPSGQADRLRQVDVTLSDQDQCSKYWSKRGMKLTADMLCAEGPGKDACGGDSGGPLVTQAADGSFKQVGVVSFGEYCPGRGPGVYARVSYALDWIASSISE